MLSPLTLSKNSDIIITSLAFYQFRKVRILSQNLVWFLPKSLSDLGMNFEYLSQIESLRTLDNL